MAQDGKGRGGKGRRLTFLWCAIVCMWTCVRFCLCVCFCVFLFFVWLHFDHFLFLFVYSSLSLFPSFLPSFLLSLRFSLLIPCPNYFSLYLTYLAFDLLTFRRFVETDIKYQKNGREMLSPKHRQMSRCGWSDTPFTPTPPLPCGVFYLHRSRDYSSLRSH